MVMKNRFWLQCAVVIAIGSYLSADAQASPVTFTYDWTAPSSVGGQQAMNALDFTSQGAVTVTTNQAVGNAALLSLQNGTSDTFANAGYTLGVTITDGSHSGTATFSGVLNGVVTNGIPISLGSTLTSPATQSLTVGSDQFTVGITGFVPPNAFGPDSKPGGFGFQITAVSGPGGGTAPRPNDVPEPTTLLLSCLGAAGFAVGARRRRTA